MNRTDRTEPFGLPHGLQWKMYCNSYTVKLKESFCCSSFRKNNESCPGNHYIGTRTLEQIVWEHMSMVIKYVTRYEAHFRSYIENRHQTENADVLKVPYKKLELFVQRAKKNIQIESLHP